MAAAWTVDHCRDGLLGIRVEHFPTPAKQAGAVRVVQGATLLDVCWAIALQESIADLSARPS
jgi:hypothetical protein